MDAAPCGWKEALAEAGRLLAIVFAIWFAFSPCQGNDFVSWDDPINITAARPLAKPDALRRIWMTREMPSYLPVTDSFWLAEIRVFGTGPEGARRFHLASIGLHVLACLALYRLLCGFIKPRWAWLAVILAAVHPWRVETVAWATEQKSLLAAVLVWWSWSAHRAAQLRGANRYQVLSVLLYALSLLAKPQAVGLPLLMLWSDIYLDELPASASRFFRLVPHLLCGLAISLIQSSHELTSLWLPPDVVAMTPLAHLLLSAISAMHYAFAFLIPRPHPLSGLPPMHEITSIRGWATFATLVLILAVLVRRSDRPSRRATLWVLCYLVFVAPTSGLFSMPFLSYAAWADRYTYLALPFLVLIVCEVAISLEGQATALLKHKPGRLWNVAPLVVFVLWCDMSQFWCVEWKDSMILWSGLLKSASGTGRFVALNNLGTEMLERGQYPAAIAHFELALQMVPDAPKTLVNLGRALLAKHRVAPAVRAIRRALELVPKDPDAHNVLGIALAQTGLREAAEKEFNLALEIDPDLVEARENLKTLAREASGKK